jgi:hypothetical protein
LGILHGAWIGGKCRLAKETIARGFGERIDASYGAHRYSVFLKAVRAGFLARRGTDRRRHMMARKYLE